MLHLDPRVHLDEVELAARVDEELERADVAVAAPDRGIDRATRDLLTKLLADRCGRRLFDHLLIAALDRALALSEADAAPVLVDRDLRLDVTHALEAALDVEARVAEGRLGLRARLIPQPLQLLRSGHLAHAATAATGARLQHHRIPDGLRDAQRLGHRLDRTIGTRDHWQAELLHRDARRDLVVEAPQDLGRRTDEHQTVLLADLREVRVLGEEAVAGMDGLRSADQRGRHDRRDVQVALARRGGTDADGFVREVHRQAVRIGLAVHEHGLDAELATRADDSQRDLAAIGDQDLIEGQ